MQSSASSEAEVMRMDPRMELAVDELAEMIQRELKDAALAGRAARELNQAGVS